MTTLTLPNVANSLRELLGTRGASAPRKPPVRVCFLIDELANAGTETQLLALIRHLHRGRVEKAPATLRQERFHLAAKRFVVRARLVQERGTLCGGHVERLEIQTLDPLPPFRSHGVLWLFALCL